MIQNRVVITVPTYWRWEQGRAREASEIAYDHPTPIDRRGTLGRLLDSLSASDYPDFRVVIITAVTDPELEEAAEERVRSIIVEQGSAHDATVLLARLW